MGDTVASTETVESSPLPSVYLDHRRSPLIHLQPNIKSSKVMMLSFVIVVAHLLFAAHAAIVTYDWNITWVTASPDGFARPVIGINGQWPLPQLTATVGDRVIINAHNHLGNRTTTLHFHGLYQNGSTHMDGSASVSQCAIPAGSSFTYDFNVRKVSLFREGRLSVIDHSSRHLLVPCSRCWPISRRLTRTSDHSRS